MSRQEVKLLGEDLAIGEDSGFLECPFCRAQHEQKFSVTRTQEGLLYHCFRASCGASGFVGTGYWEPDPTAVVKKPKRRPYRKPLHPLTREDTEFFFDTWGFYPNLFSVTEEDEYALPILDPREYRKGWVIRQPVWKGRTCHRHGVPGKPKALNYKDEPHHSKLSWAPLGDSQHVVIVEDILSAWKVSSVYPEARGVALNGADMGYNEVTEIAQVRPVDVSIWLDPDATNQAYKIQSKWGLSFNYCSVVTSDKDPKDMSPEQIEEKLSNVGWEGD